MPVLDVTTFGSKRLKSAVAIFDDLKAQHLRPCNELDKDNVRQELDRRFAIEVLDLPAAAVEPGGPVELVRMQLAQEPSIRGSKAASES
jgi:hypothetical protein